jgi:hypothetical protein
MQNLEQYCAFYRLHHAKAKLKILLLLLKLSNEIKMGNLSLTFYVIILSNLSQFLDNKKKTKSLGRLKTHLNGTVKVLCKNDRL